MTPFGEILRRTVEATPYAIGGSFADSQGEMVDAYTAKSSRFDTHDWAVLTAHFGVLLGHVEALFGTWHYGGPEFFIAQHAKLEIVVHTVAHGYYTLFAMTPPPREPDAPDRDGDDPRDVVIGALGHVREAVIALRKEMF